jgi:Protein of unknown function (DUF1353)
MCNNAVSWVFELSEDYSWLSGLTFIDDLEFKDKTGTTRLILMRNGTITVTKGYAWDGCTPKFCVFDLVVGIPDGVIDSRTRRPKTYHASLVHDALYQFVPDGLPLTRHDADRCFLRLMEETGFVFRYVYFGAVWIFGGLFRRALRRIRNMQGTRHVITRSGDGAQSP